jgi:hypothetical protein
MRAAMKRNRLVSARRTSRSTGATTSLAGGAALSIANLA